MIQRIQSVYLLVVSILMIVCMCNPVGSIIAGTQEISEFGNLFITLPDGTKVCHSSCSGSFGFRHYLPVQEAYAANPSDHFQYCSIDWLLLGFGGLHLHVGRRHQLHSVMDNLLAVRKHHPELVGYPRHRC